jgi:hypothetical protein
MLGFFLSWPQGEFSWVDRVFKTHPQVRTLNPIVKVSPWVGGNLAHRDEDYLRRRVRSSARATMFASLLLPRSNLVHPLGRGENSPQWVQSSIFGLNWCLKKLTLVYDKLIYLKNDESYNYIYQVQKTVSNNGCDTKLLVRNTTWNGWLLSPKSENVETFWADFFASFAIRHETSYSGIKLPPKFQSMCENSCPGMTIYEISYPGFKLRIQVWNFMPRF